MRFALALLLLLSFSVLGCGSDEEPDGGANPTPVPGDGEWSIEEARAFDEFTLYWLGETYSGLPLTEISRYTYDAPPGQVGSEDTVLFIYGTCTPVGEGVAVHLPFRSGSSPTAHAHLESSPNRRACLAGSSAASRH